MLQRNEARAELARIRSQKHEHAVMVGDRIEWQACINANCQEVRL